MGHRPGSSGHQFAGGRLQPLEVFRVLPCRVPSICGGVKLETDQVEPPQQLEGRGTRGLDRGGLAHRSVSEDPWPTSIGYTFQYDNFILTNHLDIPFSNSSALQEDWGTSRSSMEGARSPLVGYRRRPARRRHRAPPRRTPHDRDAASRTTSGFTHAGRLGASTPMGGLHPLTRPSPPSTPAGPGVPARRNTPRAARSPPACRSPTRWP